MTIDYTLKNGSHDSPEAGLCAMEWVAYLAGEKHTDQPVCVDAPLRSFGISLNDDWDDERRQKLRPYLVRCIGTAGDGRTEERGWLAVDWLIRTFTPAFLDLQPELKPHAEKLRRLSPVMAHEALDEAMIVLGESKEAAYAAADAAWAAAGAAAGDAAWDALKPTVEQLQDSALDLFDRMIGQGEVLSLPAEKQADYDRLLETASATTGR
jgi:hypothetical protein